MSYIYILIVLLALILITFLRTYDFFIDNRFHKVPPYIRYWFVKYNQEHRGWSPHESHMMIKYWALPFTHANDGAVINNQKEIMKYFRERVDG